MVSVIIPTYNEEKSISDCLASLSEQTYTPFEIIIVDDGSTDDTKMKIKNIIARLNIKSMRLLTQDHLGPAAARNLGVQHAKGDVLVFVDADMTFDTNFIKELVEPIENGKVIGTFSKEEYLQNKDNTWSLCWNINRYIINGWKLNKEVYSRILPTYYKDEQPVFRAIAKKEFDRVGGFDSIGYTDDWTLARKLKTQATATKGAKYYHRNPETLSEIWLQAQWIGKNEFISGTFTRKLLNLFRYSFVNSLFVSLAISFQMKLPQFIIFKIVYDLSISTSILSSFKETSRIK